MRLLRLELAGFKSFCDKAVMSFAPNGVSMVVGPNGCGKSNVVDAIRWVLGEQSAKQLRGASMEDVIFNGSAKRDSVGRARVTLTFSNEEHDTLLKYADFSEITVTRQLFRSGESDYLINNTPCRLMDIRELFMDTGIGGKAYSIIEQGRIDKIIVSRPEERRFIIDEAAGIMKFKNKRAEAEKKLEQTRQNLLRVEDIVRELTTQEVSLRAQVEKAEAYIDAKGTMEHLHKCLRAEKWFELHSEYERIQREQENERQLFEDTLGKIAQLEAEQQTGELDIVRNESSMIEQKKKVQQLREKITGLENKQLLEKERLKHIAEWQEKGEREMGSLLERLETIQKELEEQETQSNRIKTEVEKHEQNVLRLKEVKFVLEKNISGYAEQSDELNRQYLETAKRISEYHTRITQSEERLTEMKLVGERVEEQLEALEKTKEQLFTQLEEHKIALRKMRDEKEIVTENVATQTEIIEEKAASLDELKRNIEKTNRTLTEFKSRHDSLKEIEELHEELDAPTGDFLQLLKKNEQLAHELGFLGTFPDFIAEEEENIQIQAVAFIEKYLNVLFFSSYSVFPRILTLVGEENIGRIQLYFLDLQNSADEDSKSISFSGAPMHRLIRNPNDLVAGKINLAGSYFALEGAVCDISSEKLTSCYSWSLIDPHSVILSKEKIVTLGGKAEQSQVKALFDRRKEMISLLEKIKEQEQLLASDSNRLDSDREFLDETRRMTEKYKKELTDLGMALLGMEKDAHSLQQEEKRIIQQIMETIRERDHHKEEREELQLKIQTWKEKVPLEQELQTKLESQTASLRSTLEETKEKAGEETESLNQSIIALTTLKTNLNNFSDNLKKLQEEENRILQKKQAMEKEKNEQEEKSKDTTTLLAEIEKNIPMLLIELTDENEKLQKEYTLLEKSRETNTEIVKLLRQETKKMESVREASHEFELKLMQVGQEAQNIEKTLFSEYSVTPKEVLTTFNLRDFNRSEAEAKYRRLKQKIDDLGQGVNMGAPDEYKAIKERLDFLVTQSADLNKSITTLEESINKINLESKRRFKETFHLVNQQFQEMFPVLFGGGEATLVLTDENNLLETGVDIIAKPPGKKLQYMNLLSGGEKALTSISLIFAVFLIKPSPFCLLDEVDAPLDDANVVRFNKMVRKMTANSQFIIITHNRKTMEMGDILYGITMEEPGISKMVSVNFQ